jgi:hypothetical protein
MEATIRAVEQEEQSAKARRALERVCARGDFEAARDLYSSDFADGMIAEDWTASDTLDLVRQLGLRRSAVLGLRYATGRLSVDGKRSRRA